MRRKFTIQQVVHSIVILLLCARVSGKVFLDAQTYGYTGVVVAVTDNAVQNVTAALELIDNIKELITNASQFLYTVTGNRLFFEHVTILVPYWWRNFNGSHFNDFSTNELFHFAAVHVGEMNPDHGDSPYTLQRSDCSENGDYIHLTRNYLSSLHDEDYIANYGDPVKVFVGQWVMFRFGVFSEDDADLFYYDPGKNKFMPTYCANKAVVGSLINPSTKTLCYVDEFGMPLEYCRFEPEPLHNELLTSSLLFSAKFENINEFCNETTHNKFAPTLQNRRCRGKSAWEIMRRHSDFSNTTEVSINSTVPKFHVVTAHRYPSLVLAIDEAASQNKSVANAILASVSQYVLFAVPVNTLVLVVAIRGNVNDIYVHKCIRLFTDRMEIVNAVQYILFNKVADPSHATLLNHEMSHLHDFSSGAVVYITTSACVTGNWSSLKGARFLPVFVNAAPNQDLVKLADDSDGKSYAFFGNEWQLEEDLSSALFDSSHYWDGDQIVQIFSAIVNDDQRLPLSYLLDEDLIEHARVVISSTNDEALKDDLFLVSPDHFYYGNDTMIFSVNNCRTFQNFSLTNATAGMWSVRSSQQLQHGVVLVIKVFAVVPQITPVVVASADIDKYSVQAYDDNIPIPRLTIVLKKGGGLVDAASVTVTIFTPLVNGSSSNVTKTPRDDGSGADVMIDDGVYSMYVNHITANGVYKLVPKVYGGNGIDCISGMSSDCFQRAPCPLYIQVSGYVEGTSDNISPGNITDLVGKVKFNALDDAVVSLIWMAPGDASNDGKAWGYDLRLFETFEDASDFIGGWNITDSMIVDGSLDPMPPGQNQTVTVKLLSLAFAYMGTGYISVRAFDEDGNYADGSNILIIPLAPVGAQTSTTVRTTTDAYRNYTSANTTDDGGDDDVVTTAIPLHKHAYDGIISSVILLSFAMFVAGGIFIHVRIKSSKEKKMPKYKDINGAPITVTMV